MAELTLHSAIQLSKMVQCFYDDGEMDKNTQRLMTGIIGTTLNNYSYYETLYKNDKDKLQWIRMFEIASHAFISAGKKDGFIETENIIEN